MDETVCHGVALCMMAVDTDIFMLKINTKF